MDVNGNGLLIEKRNLHIAFGETPEQFTLDNFQRMCILSGCDYLPSLQGIGLNKAHKFMKKVATKNINNVSLNHGSKFVFMFFLQD